MTELESCLEKFQIEVAPELVPQLDLYCQSLWAFNKKLNLTRHDTYEKFVSRDLVDTVELSKLIPENRSVLDIGSGGGVPGIPLAILRPDLAVTLCDSTGKKTLALDQIAECLKLEIEIYNSRAEVLLEDFRFDFSTARAVGPLKKIATWLADVWLNAGVLLAIKGPKWKEEKAAADEAHLLQKVDVSVAATYPTPGTEWESVILALEAKRESDS